MNSSTLRCISRRCGSSQAAASLAPTTKGSTSTIRTLSKAPHSAPAMPQTSARASITTPNNGRLRVRGSQPSSQGKPTTRATNRYQGGARRSATGSAVIPGCNTQPRRRIQGVTYTSRGVASANGAA